MWTKLMPEGKTARNSGARHRLRAMAMVGSLVFATVMLPNLANPGVAVAGTNGQQVSVCNRTLFGYAKVTGTNQNNLPAHTPWFKDPYSLTTCYYYPNYWFKGKVTIQFGEPTTAGWLTNAYPDTCWVPQSWGSDVYQCGPYSS
jgi:hypothetical protein